MKLPITELLDDYRPEGIDIGVPDAEMTARVKARVLSRLPEKPRGRIVSLRRSVRLALLVAALLLLFGTVAYAAGLFHGELGAVRRVGNSSTLCFTDSEGNEINYHVYSPSAETLGIRFTAESEPHRVVFRPGWLPEEPAREQWSVEEGWYDYFIDDREFEVERYPAPGIIHVGIPYLITVNYAGIDALYYLQGECTLSKEDNWDGVAVYEIHCAKEIPERPAGHADWRTVTSHENYVILVSETEGWLVTVGGCESMQTLEHIARELTIRTTEETVSLRGSEGRAEYLNIGRG